MQNTADQLDQAFRGPEPRFLSSATGFQHLVEPRIHAVAVIFEFMQQLVAVRRRVDQLRELRRNPRRRADRG
jgi:hypothetical protein